MLKRRLHKRQRLFALDLALPALGDVVEDAMRALRVTLVVTADAPGHRHPAHRAIARLHVKHGPGNSSTFDELWKVLGQRW